VSEPSSDPPASSPAPPGWYPDPGGTRGWRLFDGSSWTAETKGYATHAPPANDHHGATLANQKLLRGGVVAWFAGAALLATTYVHRGSLVPAHAGIYHTLVLVSLFGLGFGWSAYTRAVASLGPVDALMYVPVANTVIWVWRAADGSPTPLVVTRWALSSRGLANALAAFQSVIACLLVFDAFAPSTRSLAVTFVIGGEAALGALVNVAVARALVAELSN